MKTTKAEWDAFWAALGPCWHCDDSDIFPESDADLAPGDTVTFTQGSLFWQRDGNMVATAVPGIFSLAQVEESAIEGHRLPRSLPAAFRKWQKSQTHDTVAVQIPRYLTAELRLFVQNNGGKIL